MPVLLLFCRQWPFWSSVWLWPRTNCRSVWRSSVRTELNIELRVSRPQTSVPIHSDNSDHIRAVFITGDRCSVQVLPWAAVSGMRIVCLCWVWNKHWLYCNPSSKPQTETEIWEEKRNQNMKPSSFSCISRTACLSWTFELYFLFQGCYFESFCLISRCN